MKYSLKKTTLVSLTAALALQLVSLVGLGVTAHADDEWSKYAEGVTTLGTTVIGSPKAPEQDTDAWTGNYVYYGQYNDPFPSSQTLWAGK